MGAIPVKHQIGVVGGIRNGIYLRLTVLIKIHKLPPCDLIHLQYGHVLLQIHNGLPVGQKLYFAVHDIGQNILAAEEIDRGQKSIGIHTLFVLLDAEMDMVTNCRLHQRRTPYESDDLLLLYSICLMDDNVFRQTGIDGAKAIRMVDHDGITHYLIQINETYCAICGGMYRRACRGGNIQSVMGAPIRG